MQKLLPPYANANMYAKKKFVCVVPKRKNNLNNFKATKWHNLGGYHDTLLSQIMYDASSKVFPYISLVQLKLEVALDRVHENFSKNTKQTKVRWPSKNKRTNLKGWWPKNFKEERRCWSFKMEQKTDKVIPTWRFFQPFKTIY